MEWKERLMSLGDEGKLREGLQEWVIEGRNRSRDGMDSENRSEQERY